MAKILVVDDDQAVQLTIQLLLERAGHSVDVANDGRKGLAKFDDGTFDLLCLDLFMQGQAPIGSLSLRQERIRAAGTMISAPMQFCHTVLQRRPGVHPPAGPSRSWRDLRDRFAKRQGRSASAGFAD